MRPLAAIAAQGDESIDRVCSGSYSSIRTKNIDSFKNLQKSRARPEKGKKREHSWMLARLEKPDAASRLKKNKIY
jgi:hypothetical protein